MNATRSNATRSLPLSAASGTFVPPRPATLSGKRPDARQRVLPWLLSALVCSSGAWAGGDTHECTITLNYSSTNGRGSNIAGRDDYDMRFRVFDGIDSAVVFAADDAWLVPGQSTTLTCTASNEYDFCKLSAQTNGVLWTFYDVADGVGCGRSATATASDESIIFPAGKVTGFSLKWQ